MDNIKSDIRLKTMPVKTQSIHLSWVEQLFRESRVCGCTNCTVWGLWKENLVLPHGPLLAAISASFFFFLIWSEKSLLTPLLLIGHRHSRNMRRQRKITPSQGTHPPCVVCVCMCVCMLFCWKTAPVSQQAFLYFPGRRHLQINTS